jgi:squalene-hopene/tetraprenyl-beta-curcumene cyclase
VEAAGKDGEAHAVSWRQELRTQLESMQRADGSWLNERNDRWYENLDILCTCYALLALEHCR